MTDDEPHWLRWARELQAHAQSGLTFTKDPFDRERYEQIRSLAADMVHVHTGEPFARVEALFSAQSGYATPKVDVRPQSLMTGADSDGARNRRWRAVDAPRWLGRRERHPGRERCEGGLGRKRL